jgi:hypothetical protein
MAIRESVMTETGQIRIALPRNGLDLRRFACFTLCNDSFIRPRENITPAEIQSNRIESDEKSVLLFVRVDAALDTGGPIWSIQVAGSLW